MLCPAACKAAFTVFVAQGKSCNLPRLGARCNKRALRALQTVNYRTPQGKQVEEKGEKRARVWPRRSPSPVASP